MHVNKCPSDHLEIIHAISINTIDNIHDIHLGTHLHVEDPLHIEIHSSVNRDPSIDQ